MNRFGAPPQTPLLGFVTGPRYQHKRAPSAGKVRFWELLHGDLSDPRRRLEPDAFHERPDDPLHLNSQSWSFSKRSLRTSVSSTTSPSALEREAVLGPCIHPEQTPKRALVVK